MSALSTIKGQDQAVSTLMRQLQSEKLAHAYLFLGPEGIGKTTTALAFAKALVCEEDPAGCGRCSACRRADEGMHPDIHTMTHASETSDIKVDQMRDLQATLALTPFEAKRKAAIIDDAERLNPSASNAFLKTLEEPSPSTVLVLVAANRSALLKTIVSRCRIVRFHPLPDNVVCDILVSKGTKPETADAVSALAAGNLKRALRLLDSDVAEQRKWFVEKIPSLGGVDPVSVADELLGRCSRNSSAETKEAIAAYLGFLAFLMRDVRVTQEGIEPPVRYSDDSGKIVSSLSQTLTSRETESIMVLLSDCRKDIDANVRPDLSLTRMFMDMAEIIK